MTPRTDPTSIPTAIYSDEASREIDTFRQTTETQDIEALVESLIARSVNEGFAISKPCSSQLLTADSSDCTGWNHFGLSVAFKVDSSRGTITVVSSTCAVSGKHYILD